MGFQAGQPRPANAGRKKGGGNRATVQAICTKLKCDPITGMATLAMDDKQKPELRGRLFAELAQYLYPKRRAIETRFVDEAGNDRELLDLASVRAYMQSVDE